MPSLRLQTLIPNPDSKHKFMAMFNDGTTTKFGARGYEDYTMHKDKCRRERYLHRHGKDLSTQDPTRAGYLSMFLLWNKPTLNQSLRDYKRRLAIYNHTHRFPTQI